MPIFSIPIDHIIICASKLFDFKQPTLFCTLIIDSFFHEKIHHKSISKQSIVVRKRIFAFSTLKKGCISEKQQDYLQQLLI